MKKIIFFLLISSCYTLYSCSEKPKDSEDDSFVSDSTYIKLNSKKLVDDSLEADYKEIFVQYMSLNRALVESQPDEASKSAEQMIFAIKKSHRLNLDSAGVNFWDEQMDAILLFLDKIQKSNDLKIQRNEFYPLSEDLYDLYVQYGIKNLTIYKQYCPMAFRDKGAFWLSKSEEILNPYFGSDMLRCGEIKEKISNP